MIALRSRFMILLRMHAGWHALLAAIGLTLIGIEAIGTVAPYYARKQMIWFVIALAAMPLCLWPRPRVIGLWAYALLTATLIMLVFVVLPFVPRWLVPRISGATSWINLGYMRLQPSELAKNTFVLAMAWYLRHRSSYRTLRGLLVPFAMVLAPVALILKQPDLGTALLFAPTLLIILIAAGAKLSHISSLVAGGAALLALTVASIYFAPPLADLALKPHQQNRFKAIIVSDDRYDDSLNYQRLKSMQLIGSGRWGGCGRDHSAMLIEAHHLPEAHNDMIFAVIVNRWGLAGAGAVLGLNLVIVMAFVLIAGRSRDPFARLVMVGLAGLIFTQSAIHVAVNIGLLPVTGITLPFVSYGGSSLVATYAMMGLALNFAALKPALLTRPSFEFDRPKTVSA